MWACKYMKMQLYCFDYTTAPRACNSVKSGPKFMNITMDNVLVLIYAQGQRVSLPLVKCDLGGSLGSRNIIPEEITVNTVRLFLDRHRKLLQAFSFKSALPQHPC